MSRRRVLIVGGAGVFGARLAEGLLKTTNAEIVIAGRSLPRAEAARTKLSAHVAVALNRDTATAQAISTIAPFLVIDAAGPFQDGALDFPRAVIAAGAHYLDLADARDFVARFPELNAIAESAGVVAFSGASSTPALTHAALDALCAGWKRIDVIRAGIAPGNRAPRGRALVEAILRWTGAPLRVWRDGAWRLRPGWSDGGAVNIEGVGRRRLALAETPDLDLMVARFAPRETAQFFAALELPILQRGVRLVGWLRQIGVWKHPERAAGPFAAAAHLLEPFGTDRGAMFVEVLGRDAHDRPTYARWTLLAPEGRGPYVPTLPALALARALLSRAPMKPGARACVGDLALDDLGADFARHGIATRIDRVLLTSPLEAALGDAFAHAPPAICAAHRAGPVTHFSGFARVRGAANPLTALARRLVGFPSAAEKAPVRVTMRLDPDATETWTRRINGSRFESHLRALAPGLVEERFGPLRFRLAVSCDAAALRMEMVSWSLGPLPLPRFLAPRSMAIEHVDEAGRFSFDVPIALPFLGRVTHYQGALTLETRP